jgi:hypothetical protein
MYDFGQPNYVYNAPMRKLTPALWSWWKDAYFDKLPVRSRNRGLIALHPL